MSADLMEALRVLNTQAAGGDVGRHAMDVNTARKIVLDRVDADEQRNRVA